MPCRNARLFLEEALDSVLCQPECLELLVADGGSTDGSLELLEMMSQKDSRVRIVSRSDSGPADALNKAFKAARGTFIGWLNADDVATPGSFGRAVTALNDHPEWLMIYGEGDEFNLSTGFNQRYPTLLPSAGLDGFRSHCFICQPTVVFRRCMAVLLGPFDIRWKTSFDFDYWLRAFDQFPKRIGYIPHLQGRTRLHEETITSNQRSQVALEAIELFYRYFGAAPATRLDNFALELQLGIAKLPLGQSTNELLSSLHELASPWLDYDESRRFCRDWNLNTSKNDVCDAAVSPVPINQTQSLPIQLFLALHPHLSPNAPGSPFQRSVRLKKAIDDTRYKFSLLKSEYAEPVDYTFSSTFGHRPFGVNLIGHAFEVFGIGEDIRMACRALQAVDVPCSVVHHPAGNGAQCHDRSLEHLLSNDPSGGPYAFNLVCLAAPIHARWLLESTDSLKNSPYTIAAWPWETPQWPDCWLPLLEVVDEIWPSSNFIANSLKHQALERNIPSRVMSMSAEIPDPDRFCTLSSRENTRKSIGLPSNSIVFCFSFDFNSTANRKNPMAILEAFQHAFPLPELFSSMGRQVTNYHLSNNVALLIKTFPSCESHIEWEWLTQRAREDGRIHLIQGSLERDDLLAIYGSCDVFISLHRSEGFGRGLAEALQLGLDVIATGYGGNTDFCFGALSHLVRFREVPIPRGAYHFADGHYWAEPDLDHAIEIMRKIATRRSSFISNPRNMESDICRNADILASYRDYFSLAAVGSRYKSRLKYIWDKQFNYG